MGEMPCEAWDISNDLVMSLENLDYSAANDETSEEDIDDGLLQHDILIHKWCQRQLGHLLSKLSLEPEAAPFLVPVDWKKLGLDDYPEIVQTPMDLHTIRKRLDAFVYNDADSLVDPELFFRDLALCWENCLDYFEDDLEIEAVQMALKLSSMAKRMEETFWADLAAFEESLEKRPLTTKVALAATRIGDAAKKAANKGQRKTVVFTNDMVTYAAEWWQGKRKESPFWKDEEFKEQLIGLAWPSRFKRGISVVRETVRRVPPSLLGSEQAVQTFLKPLAESILRTVSSLSMPSGVRVVEDTIADIKGEWILPENFELPSPNSHAESVLVWAHGGGFVLCSPATHRFFLARIVVHTGIPTFCVDFRKPPRHPFPVPRDDILSVYKGILELGNADMIFMGGDSAGGNLVLSVTKELAELAEDVDDELSLPVPAGLILLSPWVDLSDTNGESWQKYGNVDYIPSRQAEVIAGIYAKGVPLRDCRVSPGLCSSWPSCFPRTLLDYGGCEVFRTQIERLADNMLHHGVELDATVQDGMVHCYPQLEYLWGPDPDGLFDAYFQRVSTFMAMKYF